MTENLPEKPDRKDNKKQHEDQTGLTKLWKDVAGMDQAPSASERHNYYIQTGAVWLAFKDIVSKNEKLSHYRTNIAFNMSSGVGWDIKKGTVPFYYPPGESNIHPFDFYVPVDHVIEQMEYADRFALNLERMVHGKRPKKNPSQNKYQEGFLSKLTFKIFHLDPYKTSKIQKLIKHLNPTMSYEEKYLELGKMLVEALRQNKDLIKHKSELDKSNWTHYDPDSGQPSPFYLSANEMGASFDFTMRK